MSRALNLKVSIEPAEIEISSHALVKLHSIMTATDKEIAWHGIVYKRRAGKYYLEDLVIYPQEVTCCTVKTDIGEYGKWVTKMALESPRKFDNMKYQAHSHIRMGVEPSLTDISHQAEIIDLVADDGFYIFQIFNKNGDVYTNIYDFEDNTRYVKARIVNVAEKYIMRQIEDNVSDYGIKGGSYEHRQVQGVF